MIRLYRRFRSLPKTALTLPVIATAMLFVSNALATDRYWSGASYSGDPNGNNDDITNPDNWYSPGQPNSGDNLNFNNSTNHKFVYFDYGNYYTFGNINIYNAAGNGQFYGNALKFTDYIKNNDNSNQWRVYNGNVSATTTGGSTTVFVVANGGGFNFKLDNATAGGGNGDGGHFYLDGYTLDVQGTGATTFQCIISDGGGTGHFKTENSSTVTMSGSNANAYTGATMVAAGTLLASKSDGVNSISGSSLSVSSGATFKWGANNQVSDSANVTLNGGGTLNSAGFSEGTRPSAPTGGTAGSKGMGALTLSNTNSGSHAVIDFGSGSLGSTLAFDSLGSGVTNATYLDINNWTGLARSDSGNSGYDRLLFANNPSLSDSNLANFAFYNDAGALIATGGTIISYGDMWEIVPIPEPSTYLAGILALSALAYSQRRRLGRVLKLA